MPITMVAAVAENGVIGSDGGIPWWIPSDFKWFKHITADSAVIMGRKTWESLPVKPLPGRENVVLTSDPLKAWAKYGFNAAWFFTNSRSFKSDKMCIIGGESLYREFLPQADQLYITHVHASIEGDTYFPTIDPSVWKSTLVQWPISPKDQYPYTIKRYTRIMNDSGGQERRS